ncbi:MAG: hypothetical protein DRR08_05375 [Candidatus Parabeggiatoa sp. nov. 2]|nr:MAG: hypothetical protein B6247_18885 [Beggiatoa sp. 4572_84]RKZ62720.1 MAG: hypothetical protein DRR08_05375 [Gammaproteobacteria bacterium]
MLANYTRIRLISSRYQEEGLSKGAIGYIIETYDDGAYEVEFSAPDGTTIAQLVLEEDEIQRAELPNPKPVTDEIELRLDKAA